VQRLETGRTNDRPGVDPDSSRPHVDAADVPNAANTTHAANPADTANAPYTANTPDAAHATDAANATSATDTRAAIRHGVSRNHRGTHDADNRGCGKHTH
jgi:hypothetical protein